MCVATQGGSSGHPRSLSQSILVLRLGDKIGQTVHAVMQRWEEALFHVYSVCTCAELSGRLGWYHALL